MQNRPSLTQAHKMGGSNSTTRKITIVNDEQSGVIKVSDAVVRRLKGEAEVQAAAAATERPPSKPTPPPQIPTPIITPPVTVFEQQQYPSPLQPPPSPKDHGFTRRASASGLPYEELYQQAMHHRQERDEQIRKIDGRWRERLELAEKQNAIIENALREKYVATVSEIRQILPKRRCDSVCKENEINVYECYKSNMKTSLNCSKEVREFNNCIQGTRLNALKKG